MAQAGGGISRGTSGALLRMIMNQRAKTGQNPSQEMLEAGLTAGIKDASGRAERNRELDIRNQMTQSNIGVNESNISRNELEMSEMIKRRKAAEEAARISGYGQIGLGILKGIPMLNSGMKSLGIPGLDDMGRSAIQGIGNLGQQAWDWGSGMFDQQPQFDFGGGGGFSGGGFDYSGDSWWNPQSDMGGGFNFGGGGGGFDFGGSFDFGGEDWWNQQSDMGGGFGGGGDFSGGGFDYSGDSWF